MTSRPAFDAALAEARANIDAIAADPEPPSFANTIEAMERAQPRLDRVAAVFFGLAGAHTNDAIEALQRDLSPRLAAHHAETMMNARALRPRRRAATRDATALGLTPEQERVLDALPPDVRPGRRPAGRRRPRPAEGGDAAAGEPRHRLRPERARRREGLGRCRSAPDDLEGLPADLVAAAAQAAAERGRGGPRRHPVAQPDRAVPELLAAARPARAGVPRLGGARRERRRDRQPRRSSPRRWRCARSGRGCSATATSPPTSSSRRWRRRRRRCASS